MMTETRAKSTKKPEDRKEAQPKSVQVEFAGEVFEVETKLVTSARTMRLFEAGMIMNATERLIGEDEVERLLDAIEAVYGDDDLEHVGKFTEAVFTAAKAKN